MKFLGQLGRYALTFVIIFQFSIGTAIASSGDGGRSSSSNYGNPSDKYAINLLKAAQDIESGEFFNKDAKSFDVFGLVDQRVEIYSGNARDNKVVSTVSLNENRIEKPTLAYTSLKPRYNTKTKELVFEASRGAQADGSGGTIVARHIIPNLDLVGMVHDSEMLLLLDRKGKLHAIDMGYVISQVFQNPIPTFKKLWESQTELNLEAQDVRLEFITRGVQPVNVGDAVVPLNRNGEPVFTAGDLLVRYNEGSKEKVLGVFSRQVTYDRIREGSALLASLSSLITPDKQIIEFFSKNEGKIESLIQTKVQQLTAAAEVFSPLQNFDVNQLKALAGRMNSIETEYKPAAVDQFTLAEWARDYEQIKANATDAEKADYFAKRAKSLQETAVGDEAKKIYRDGYNQFLADLEAQQRLQTSEGMGKGWQLLTDQAARQNPFDTGKAKAEKPPASDRSTEWKIIGAVTAGTVAYLSGAFMYTGMETLQNIQILSWLYDNLYTEVMKDLMYRIPLAKSVLAWIAVIPGALATSMFLGKVIDLLAIANKNKSTAFAVFVRDIQKTWGTSMKDMQRIISAGMRAYSFIVYPYLRVTIETVLRQKSFLSAYENGLNPLRRISPNSATGQELGLQKSEYVGLNNPAARNMPDVTAKKKQIQSALSLQKTRVDSLAWVLATMVVAEKSGIDPATLLQASDQRVTPDDIRKIFSDPAKEREWELLSDEIRKDLTAKNALTLKQEVNSLSPEKIAEFYLSAQETAKKISAMSEVRQKAALRWKKMKTTPVDTLNFLLLENGKSDALFLRSLVTDEFVSKQVNQEFRTDHLMVVLISAFIGDRAKMADPKSLTAQADGFMWTSHEHNYDMVLNTFAHFFVSGASLALVFQKLRPQQETNYLPKEQFELMSDYRHEGFWRGVGNWLSFGYNERTDKTESLAKKPIQYMYNLGTEADIGGIMVKRVKKRLNTIQAGLTLALVFRTAIGGLDPVMALQAWALMFMAGHWFYGWVWDPVQRGNQMIDERLEKHNREFMEAKLNISRGLKENNLEMVEKGYREMTALFEKYNPKAVAQLKNTVNDGFGKALKGSSGAVNLSGEQREYLGILALLAKANKQNNQAEFDRALAQLREVLVNKQGYDRNEVLKLNAQSLLEFSLSNPPVYTHSNKFLSEVFTLGAGGLTTFMYLPLSIMLFDPASLSPESLTKWFFISTGLYFAAWSVFGKTPWLFYEKISKMPWLASPASLYYRARSRIALNKTAKVADQARVATRTELHRTQANETRGLLCRSLFN